MLSARGRHRRRGAIGGEYLFEDFKAMDGSFARAVIPAGLLATTETTRRSPRYQSPVFRRHGG